MAEVRPFRGLRYSSSPTSTLTKVLCPPYDVITREQQESLQSRSAYNAVHLELPQGNDAERYALAAKTLERWQQEGVLVRDSRHSYYLLRHRFRYKDRNLERWGLIASVRLEKFEHQIILPHEETGSAAKDDRLQLMKACNANLSPIMALYRDPQRHIKDKIERIGKSSPNAIAMYEDDQELALWVVEASELDDAMQATFKDAPLFIADGHHRYETSLLYRDQARQQAESWQEKDALNYVMMTLIDFDDPGLLVLPYHRTLGSMDPPTLTAVRNRLLELFQVQPFTPQPATPEALQEAVVQQGQGVALGLLGPEGEGPYLLGLRHGETLDKLRALSGGIALSDSAGWVLHQAVLEPILGHPEDYLTYAHDPKAAWDSVVHGRQQMAFFLKPFPMDLFQAVVSTGQRLPPKSTYFSPKLPTGLVFNLLEGKVG